VLALAFSPDSRLLAVGSADKTASVWDVSGIGALRDRAVEFACSWTRRGLDQDEWARFVTSLPYQDTCRP
jgi:WD40 repeat protein